MADRAPNTDGDEPETSSEALLDELVRALAREMAERDPFAIKPAPRHGPLAARRTQDERRRHLCPLFVRFAAGGVDRGPEQDLPRTRRERRLVYLSRVQRQRHIGRELDPARHPEAVARCAGGPVTILLAESLDRLSRDQEDIAHIFKRISFAGGRIVTLSEGEINELHIGLKGTMGALYLKDLADKTRRGLRGRVEAGKSGGGNSYGYDVVRGLGPDGLPLTGERKINAREASIVCRIFVEYAAGVSPRAIAKRLNAEGVPGPSGKAWG
jgi:Resolvase, N terminal domain/Recombinase